MELSEVRELGWFLELEILAPDDHEAVIARYREELLSLLEKLEIPPEKIEKKPYTEMLAAKQV
jgi:adenylate cyclase class IV